MKKLLLLFALATAYLLYSCGQQNKVPLLGYLTPKNLPSQSFTIDITKDTALTTADGIKIKIPANSIQSKSSTVTLEVKEALSIGEMLKAGLTTRSDKGILRSEGMFYINTKEEASIVKPISIDVPTSYADSSMQLYKGKEGKDGAITWENPEALQTAADPGVENGGAFFRTNCASCHSIEKKLTGPALGWVTKRRSMTWLKEFTRNSAAVLASGDPYSCCIFQSYNKMPMMAFPILTDNDIANIYKYIDRESKRLGVREDIGANYCDSCNMSAEVLHGLVDKLARLKDGKDSLVEDNGKMTILKYRPDTRNETVGTRNENTGRRIKVIPPAYRAEYYQFKITAFGWYNIDALLDKDNFSETELKVQLNSPQTNHINMYLVVPSEKIFTEGGMLEDLDYWGFYELNGKLKLPHGAQAYVVAIGEEAGKTYFGSTAFAITDKQTIEVKVTAEDKTIILEKMTAMQLTDVVLQIDKTKNHDQLKAIQSTIDSLQHVLSRCSCLAASDSAAWDYEK